jgi:hypothetical protein
MNAARDMVMMNDTPSISKIQLFYVFADRLIKLMCITTKITLF